MAQPETTRNKKRFSLVATVSTDNPEAVRPVLDQLIRGGSITKVAPTDPHAGGKGVGEFRIQAQMEGESAKDLNRSLLSALRRTEKKTRLRAEWTSGNTVERFFDYVLKKTVIK
jgi:hypothetical protein